MRICIPVEWDLKCKQSNVGKYNLRNIYTKSTIILILIFTKLPMGVQFWPYIHAWLFETEDYWNDTFRTIIHITILFYFNVIINIKYHKSYIFISDIFFKLSCISIICLYTNFTFNVCYHCIYCALSIYIIILLTKTCVWHFLHRHGKSKHINSASIW